MRILRIFYIFSTTLVISPGVNFLEITVTLITKRSCFVKKLGVPREMGSAMAFPTEKPPQGMAAWTWWDHSFVRILVRLYKPPGFIYSSSLAMIQSILKWRGGRSSGIVDPHPQAVFGPQY